MTSTHLNLYGSHLLNSDVQDIRVLQLYPGTGGQKIQSTLQITNLSLPSAAYIALSYVWGTEMAQEKIELCSHDIQITQNLLTCLRYLRHPRDIVRIWVDAICINQDDLQEKSSQVAVMGAIYLRCSEVCCWLGAPPDPVAMQSVGDPFHLLHHFAEDKHYYDLPGYVLDKSNLVRFVESKDFQKIWEGFLSIANSPWGTRAWTVQEVILPTISVICYGTWRSTFDTLIRARRMRNIHLRRPCCTESHEAFPVKFRREFDRFLNQIEYIERLRQADLPKDDPLSSKGQPLVFPDLCHPPFYELALTFSSRSCKKPLDKVFSLLAMSKSPDIRGFLPDYTCSIAEAYEQTFRLMLNELGNDFRCLIGPMFATTQPNFPSWVPDFSSVFTTSITKTHRRILLSSLYRASGDEVGKVTFDQLSKLSVRGLRADTITAVGPVLQSPLMSVDTMRQVLAECIALVERLERYATGETNIRIPLWRILCASVADDGAPIHGPHRCWRRMQQTDAPSDPAWREFMEGNIWALPERCRGVFEDAVNGRSLFVTETGRAGLCYDKVQSGDQVWVLRGSNLPFVLRENCSDQMHMPSYRFIGDCFLDGIMDGEMVASDTNWSLVNL